MSWTRCKACDRGTIQLVLSPDAAPSPLVPHRCIVCGGKGWLDEHGQPINPPVVLMPSPDDEPTD